MTINVAVYLRCSTEGQDTTNQVIPLREYANRMNYRIVNEYCDHGISGSKSRNDRPALNEMMKDAVKGKFSKILVYSIDRLGRNISHLIEILDDLGNMKINLFFLSQGIDTETHHGKMVFQLMGILAQWERELIKERINVGISRAKSQGKHCGRPTNINESLVNAVMMLRNKGMGIRKIATELKIGVCTTMKILKSNQLQTI
jgi:DNA invertase Pin-like site-specific DNA recombinase